MIRAAALVLATGVVVSGCQRSKPADLSTFVVIPYGTVDRAGLERSATILRHRLAVVPQGKDATVTVRTKDLVLKARRNVAREELTGLVVQGEVTIRRVVRLDATPQTYGQCHTPRPASETVSECRFGSDDLYQLEPAALTSKDVRSAQVVLDRTTGNSTVEVEFRPASQHVWNELTRDASVSVEPTNRVAISLDGQVLAAPTILSEITGPAQITSEQSALENAQLAAILSSGELPYGFYVLE